MTVALYAIGLALVALALPHFPRATMVAIVLVPLSALFGGGEIADAFSWIKLYSVAAGLLWLHVLRLTPLSRRPWALALGLAVLQINIAEAVAFDIARGNWINALSGAALIASSARIGPRAASVGEDGRLRWDAPLLWTAAYTAWNLTFVLGVFPEYAAPHLAVAGVPLLLSLRRPALYLERRALILYAHMALTFVAPSALVPLFDAPWARSPALYTVAAALAFLTCGATLASRRMVARWNPALALPRSA